VAAFLADYHDPNDSKGHNVKPTAMDSSEANRTIKLPERIVDRVEDRLPRTEWDEPEEYITYVLEEVLYRVEKETENDDFEPVDETEVKSRLKSLGYLNE
jgi:hypothetical protein